MQKKKRVGIWENCGKGSKSNYKSLNIDDFRLVVAGAVSDSWIIELTKRLDTIPRKREKSNRWIGLVSMPTKFGAKEAFVKVVEYRTILGRRFWKHNVLKRLRPGDAFKEAQNYMKFKKLGLPTPNLILYGERWRWGLCHRGIVVTERVCAPNLRKRLKQTEDIQWGMVAIDALVKIHNSGYSHGDANLQNFIFDGSKVLFLDLGNSKRLNNKTKLHDLICMATSVIRLTNQEEIAYSLLTRYENSSLSLPLEKNEILHLANKKSKIKMPKNCNFSLIPGNQAAA